MQQLTQGERHRRIGRLQQVANVTLGLSWVALGPALVCVVNDWLVLAGVMLTLYGVLIGTCHECLTRVVEHLGVMCDELKLQRTRLEHEAFMFRARRDRWST